MHDAETRTVAELAEALRIAVEEIDRLRTRLDEARTTMLSFGIHDDLRCHCCAELFASNDPDHVRCGICSQVCRYLEHGAWERGKHCPALNK